jgi:N-acetylmuramoyl-L-alanine amidase
VTLLNFAGSPHGGARKLLPEWRSQPRITPTTIIDHSIVGSALGAWWYFHDSTGIESHFIVNKRGVIWQLMDTGREADANLRANRFAISIETEDNGHPDTDPWTQAQLESLNWLHNKLRAVHRTIPRRRCPSEAGGGLGHHTQFGAPSEWTPTAKTCPGKPVRVRQWERLLLPAFLSGEQIGGLSMADAQDILDRLTGIYHLLAEGDETHQFSIRTLRTVLGRVEQDVTALQADVAELNAKVDQLVAGGVDVGAVADEFARRLSD